MPIKNYSILIVDDEPDIIRQIADYFTKAGLMYRFFHATNGELALKIALSRAPDLVILDWEMPGMNGIQVLQALKSNAKLKDIPVIMATGIMISSDNLKTALESGASDYIRKPIDPLELIARTRSILVLSEYHKENLKYKDKELALHAMHLLQHKTFNTKLFKQLKEIYLATEQTDGNAHSLLKTLIRQTEILIREEETWKNFRVFFDLLQPEFIKKLLDKSPNLTPAEIKLSIFLRLQMTTKDIAIITFQEVSSIKTSRKRLRKKLGLETNVHMINFLYTF